MSCDEVMDAMNRELDGDLTAEERQRMQHHLLNCPRCVLLYERLRCTSACGGFHRNWKACQRCSHRIRLSTRCSPVLSRCRCRRRGRCGVGGWHGGA